MAIQTRRGNYVDFDKTRMLPGEPAAVLAGDPSTPSGKSFYVCYSSGDVRRLVSIEDLNEMVESGEFKGEKGDKGASVQSADINDAGHLILRLDDGTEIDAGLIDDALAKIDEAKSSAEAAAQSETNAAGSEERAKGYADNASQSAAAASESATNAGESASSAKASEDNAKASAEAAKTSEDNAAASEGNASDSADSAAQSALSASTSAANAEESMTSAGESATAASESATNAENSATNAAQSETDAEKWAKLSQSYANGESASREGEETDNAKEYARQAADSAKKASEIAGGDFVTHSEVGAPGGVASLDGTGKIPHEQIPDDIGMVQGVRGEAEEEYQIGNVTITKESLGIGNVLNPQIMSLKLMPDEWTGLESPYEYTIELTDVSDDQLVYGIPAMGLTQAQFDAFSDACITSKDHKDGKAILQAINKPDTELPIVLIIGSIASEKQ